MNGWSRDMLELLRQMTMFEDLTDDKLKSLIKHGTREQYKAGSIVFHAGDQGDAFYVIESGQVEVQVQSGEITSMTVIAVLSKSEYFGEMALITNEPRSATIHVIKDAAMLRIKRRDFENLVSDVAVYHRLVDLVCARLRQTSYQLEEAQRARVALSHYLRSHPATQEKQLVGSCHLTRKLTEAIEAAASSDGPVLIEGKPGTGRSFAAALIVRRSSRADGPMVTIDCIESGARAPSEIFGHEAGASPDPHSRQIGALELCAYGTVVIAEPQRLSMTTQERLIQAIKTESFRRIGGDQDIPRCARIIITQEIGENRSVSLAGNEIDSLFTGGHIHIPNLSQRRLDIPEIAETLLDKYCRVTGKPKAKITTQAMERLLSYDWPGNVDELDTVIRRAIALAPNGSIEAEHILIYIPPSGKEGKLNVLQIPWLSRFFKSRWYPTLFQVPTLAVFGLIIYLCFFGP